MAGYLRIGVSFSLFLLIYLSPSFIGAGLVDPKASGDQVPRYQFLGPNEHVLLRCLLLPSPEQRRTPVFKQA